MKRRLKIIDRILDALKDCRTFAICGHMRPDGDCIGSQLALAYSLHERDRKVIVWNQDPMPEKLAFLDPKKLLATPKSRKSFDAVITTDCANYERLGTICPCIEQRGLLINIDHHAGNTMYGDLNWHDVSACACAEMVFELIDRGEMYKTEHDQLSDFTDVYSFDRAFDLDYEIDTSPAFSHQAP